MSKLERMNSLCIQFIFLATALLCVSCGKKSIVESFLIENQEASTQIKGSNYFKKSSIEISQVRMVCMKLTYQHLIFEIIDFQKESIHQKKYTNRTINQLYPCKNIIKAYDILYQIAWEKRKVQLIGQTTLKIEINYPGVSVDTSPEIQTTQEFSSQRSLHRQLYQAIFQKYRAEHSETMRLVSEQAKRKTKNMPFYFSHALSSSLNFKYIYQKNTIQKINQNEWTQLVNVRKLPNQGNFKYSFGIESTANKEIIVGIMTNQGLTRQSSFSQIDSIAYNFNNGVNYKAGTNFINMGSGISGSTANISMVIDMNQRLVSWFIDDIRQSTLDFPSQFTNKQLYPYLELRTRGDQLRILANKEQQKALIEAGQTEATVNRSYDL